MWWEKITRKSIFDIVMLHIRYVWHTKNSINKTSFKSRIKNNYTLNSSCWRIDIVLTKDGICTLTYVVITDPTWADLFPRSCATQGFVASDVTQAKEARAKERNYHNWHPSDQFLPSIIEIWLFIQTCRCVFTWLCQCHLEHERDKKPSSFYLGPFSLFWSHYKGCKRPPS
jgi:hypothetical protein